MGFRLKKVPATTNNLTTGIINYLLNEGHVAVRINVQGQWDEGLQMWRKSGSTKGVLDVACTLCPTGRHLVIDTKTDRDKASVEQLAYAQDVLRAGGLAYFAKTYDDFVQYYQTRVKPTLK